MASEKMKYKLGYGLGLRCVPSALGSCLQKDYDRDPTTRPLKIVWGGENVQESLLRSSGVRNTGFYPSSGSVTGRSPWTPPKAPLRRQCHCWPGNSTMVAVPVPDHGHCSFLGAPATLSCQF